jgi:hypothetical protein
MLFETDKYKIEVCFEAEPVCGTASLRWMGNSRHRLMMRRRGSNISVKLEICVSIPDCRYSSLPPSIARHWVPDADWLAEHREEQKSDLRDGFITTKSYLEMKEGKVRINHCQGQVVCSYGQLHDGRCQMGLLGT